MTTDSPLSQALPNSLDVLFNKDPDKLTSEELMTIVTALRAERARWTIADKAKKSASPKVAAPSKLTLDELEI